jgi:tetratricopeptide (TPR) repeat protein
LNKKQYQNTDYRKFFPWYTQKLYDMADAPVSAETGGDNMATIEERFDRGNECYFQGDYDNAIAEFTRILAEGQNCYAYSNRGKCYFARGDFDSAIADYTQVLELSKEPELRAEAFMLRGDAYNEKSDYDSAIADANRTFELNPQDENTIARAFLTRGFAYLKKSALCGYNGEPKNSIIFLIKGLADKKRGVKRQKKINREAKRQGKTQS